MGDILPPLKPIPIKERLSILYIEYGQLDVLDGPLWLWTKQGSVLIFLLGVLLV